MTCRAAVVVARPPTPRNSVTGAPFPLATASVSDPSPARMQCVFKRLLAERVGFEPTVPLRVRRISSAVLSTTQPPLREPGLGHQSGAC